jgi:predicted transcriptional regulator
LYDFCRNIVLLGPPTYSKEQYFTINLLYSALLEADVSHAGSIIQPPRLAIDSVFTRLDVTRKQYHSRISALMKTGLISKRDRQYMLTSLGKIVYDAQMMIGRATNTYWKLRAIDSLETEHKIPADERNKITNTLIDNQDIIKILVKQS